jgi:hypothetical protein
VARAVHCHCPGAWHAAVPGSPGIRRAVPGVPAGSHPPGMCAGRPRGRRLQGSPACRPGPCPLRRRAVRHFVRPRLHGGVMKRARRSFESFAALAKAGAAPGKRETGGTVSRRSRTGTTGRADVVPGPPSAMPPQHTPLDGAVVSRTPLSGAASTGARRGHRGGTGTLGGDEQARFPALPRDRHPSSGHPLPDMPHHHRLPARESQRCPDRALPPGPPRNTRPPLLPVASRTQIAHRPHRPLPGRAQPARQDHPQTPGGHRPRPTRKAHRDIRPGAPRRLAAAINWAVHTRSIWCTRSPPGRPGKHPDLPM